MIAPPFGPPFKPGMPFRPTQTVVTPPVVEVGGGLVAATIVEVAAETHSLDAPPHLSKKGTISRVPTVTAPTKATEVGGVIEGVLVILLVFMLGGKVFVWMIDEAGKVLDHVGI